MKKKLLSMLLALTMVTSLFSGMTITAGAEGAEEPAVAKWVTVAAGAEEPTEGWSEPVTLTAAFAAANSAEANKVTYVKLNDKVVISGSSLDYVGLTLDADKTMVLDLGEAKDNDTVELAISGEWRAVSRGIQVNGDLTVKNGDMTFTNPSQSGFPSIYGIDVGENGKLTVDNCGIEAKAPVGTAQGIVYNVANGTTNITVSNSTIDVDGNRAAYGINLYANAAVLRLSDTSLTVKTEGTESYGVSCTNRDSVDCKIYLSGDTTISGAKVGIDVNQAFNGAKILAHDGNGNALAAAPKGKYIVIDGTHINRVYGATVVYGVTEANAGNFKPTDDDAEICVFGINNGNLVTAKPADPNEVKTVTITVDKSKLKKDVIINTSGAASFAPAEYFKNAKATWAIYLDGRWKDFPDTSYWTAVGISNDATVGLYLVGELMDDYHFPDSPSTSSVSVTVEGYQIESVGFISNYKVYGYIPLGTRAQVLAELESSSTVPVTGVTLDKENLALTVGGETGQLNANVAPENATNKAVTWSSGNTAIATVAGGVVTAVAPGEATITVATTDGNFTDTCLVTVTAAQSGGDQESEFTDYIEFTFDASEFTPLFYGQRDRQLNSDQVEAAFATRDNRVHFWDSHAGDYFDSYVTELTVYKKSGESYDKIRDTDFLQIGDEIYLQAKVSAKNNDIDFTNTRIKVNGEAVEVVRTNHLADNWDTITFRFKLGNVLAKIAVAEDIIGGTVSVDKTTAEKGEVVTVAATPAAGYVLKEIIYRENSEGTTENIIEGNTFEVPRYNVLVTAKFASENIVTIDKLDIKLDKAAESLEAGDFFCEEYIPFTVSQSGVTIKYSGWLIKATQDHFNNGCLYDESQIGDWLSRWDFARVPELTDTDTFALYSAVEVDGVNYQFADTIVNASDFDNFYHNGNYIEFEIEVGTLADIRAAQNAGVDEDPDQPDDGGTTPTPPASSSSTPTVQPPVSNDKNSVNVQGTVYDNEVTINPLTDKQLDKILSDENASGDVVIDLTGLNKPIDGAGIPKKTMEAIVDAAEKAGNDTEHLVIKLTTAELTLDDAAMRAIVDQADGHTIRIHFDDVGTSRLNAAQKENIKDMDIRKGFEAYISVDGKRVSDFKGGEVEIVVPYAVPAGENVTGFSVWYIDENGNPEKLKSTYDGKQKWFVVTHFSDYVIAYNADDVQTDDYSNCPKDETCPIHPFTDTNKQAWYHDGVHYCIDNGYMIGVGNNQFAPSGITTRAQIVTILWRMEGSPLVAVAEDFDDVRESDWYNNAIRWASANGVVEGYGNGAFGPNDTITREQVATILWRYCKYKGIDVSVGEETNILSYEDAFDVSSWAMEAMQWACGSGMIQGIDKNNSRYLDPQGNADRSQNATMIFRFCTEIQK